jgi:hypothetical protein
MMQGSSLRFKTTLRRKPMQCGSRYFFEGGSRGIYAPEKAQ